MLELHTLPIIAMMDVIDTHLGGMFQLLQGRSAETSGGLMVILPADSAEVCVWLWLWLCVLCHVRVVYGTEGLCCAGIHQGFQGARWPRRMGHWFREGW